MENIDSMVQNFMVKAQSYKITYDYIRAIDCHDKTLQIDPKNINALFDKGVAYHNLEKYYKAIDCIDKVL